VTERQIPDEASLVAEARAFMRPLAAREPRIGFATRVALNARDRRQGFTSWLRWTLGGLAVAGAAALAVSIALPAPHHEDEMLAQRLDLFEDLAVVQNQQALEDLDVVEVLHTLQPEARP
jgi:anti-sigma-K factor RskA